MAKKSKKRRRRQYALLRALERRVAQLEQRDPTAVTGRPPPRSDDVTPDAGRWALAELRRRVTPPGGVVIAGAIDLPDGAHVDWQGVADTTTLLDRRWEPSTDRLAALAHPVRIDLLRQVLLGARTTAALIDLEIVGSGGSCTTTCARCSRRGGCARPPAAGTRYPTSASCHCSWCSR